MPRSLLTSAVIVILLASMRTRAADVITLKSPANLGFDKVAVHQRRFLDNLPIKLFQTMTERNSPTLTGLDILPTRASGDGSLFSELFAPRSGDGVGSISFVSSRAKPVLASGQRRMKPDDGVLSVEPATMDFGTVPLGLDENQIGTLIASDSDVTVSSATINSPQFTLSGLSLPFIIPAGGRQEYTVTFTPQTVGAAAATLTFVTDGNSLATQGLIGMGGQPSHMVDLSWNASTSQDVIGYNVYRSTVSGGPYARINSVLDPSTFYADVFVSNGATYYYVSTAVDSSGQESVYSNEVQAVIP